jgi:D-psicose/D-tagatose/L-ribulose 3-epimerase
VNGVRSAMRFGVNTFIWRSPFATPHDLDLVEHAADLGADVFEVAVEDPDLIDAAALGAALRRRGLSPVVCGAFGPGRDVGDPDPAVRASTLAYLARLTALAEALGAGVVAGPAYGSVGLARPLDDAARRAERDRVVASLREAAVDAAGRGVRLALEPLNRFETDRVNTVEQGLRLCDDVGHEAVGLHLDTFHMHLEERDSGAAVRAAAAAGRLFHVHACENDRGVPGRGQVAWRAVADALTDVGYDGDVVIESFTPAVLSIAGAVCLWRPVAPDQDTIAREGLDFLRGLLG